MVSTPQPQPPRPPPGAGANGHGGGAPSAYARFTPSDPGHPANAQTAFANGNNSNGHGAFAHAAPFLRASSNGASIGAARDFLHESHGGLRFARDAEEPEDAPEPVEIVPWRMRERMKTMDVALVLCLNIGTDPPDVAKASPCARKECWVDPFSMPAQKALETIGKTLQSQYERWQPRARYRQSLDPTVDEIKQLGVSLRRHAKNDRVLFHYNGHGVPRPTPNGEVWVFNKSYTQYIPLLVYDLQSWIGTPSIYVFDCSAAGILLSHFNDAAAAANGEAHAAGAPPGQGEAIVLAACGPDEILPMNPELCADVFTSCLTTPITVALRWFISQNEMSMSHVDGSFIDRIPGKLTDRKTPLGELNWIFTAITDTIAWNVLPRELFQKLFRQDLLVASLFRNFLLAERIMKSEGCSPCSLPALPPTNHHPLWRSWDLAAEICLNQLYKISHPHPYAEISMQPSRFFAEQLTAFEVWLQFGSPSKAPPQQLPMVLQVLLSQVHRLRALVLLKKFLDLGPWAVNLALSVGIFPYVLKLLQSPASELRQVLVFIWAKILALDPSCQVDLVKDDGHSYFITHLAAGMQATPTGPQGPASAYGGPPGSINGQHSGSVMPSDQKVLSAFILSVICNNCPQGQKSCLQQYLHRICASTLTDPSEDVRRWICLCLAKLWENFEDAKRVAIDDQVHKLVSLRLRDERPEVRAAAAFALGSLVGLQFDGSLYGPTTDPAYVDEFLRQRARGDMLIAAELLWGCQDASPFVRRESVLAIANVILHTYHQPRFEIVARHIKNRPISHHHAGGGSTQAPSPHPSTDPLGGDSINLRPNSTYSRGVDEASLDRSFPIGVGIDIDSEIIDAIGEDAKYYVHIWHVLKEMQADDPFPKVVSDVKRIVSRVNASIWAADKATEAQRETTVESKGVASSQSPPPRSPSGQAAIHREGSAPSLQTHIGQATTTPVHDPAQDRGRQAGRAAIGHVAPSISGGMRPSQSVGNLRGRHGEDHGTASGMAPSGRPHLVGTPGGRPVLSEHNPPRSIDPAGANAGRWPGQTPQQAQAPLAPPPLPTHGRHADFPQKLKSILYDRQKARFNEPILEPLNEGDDPLSEKGGEKLERIRRFERIRKAALKIAPGFATPATQDRGYMSGSLQMNGGGMLNSTTSTPINYPQNMLTSRTSSDKYDARSFTMTVRQRAVLNNEAEMTSLLLFHPYEKTLIVADEKDQISLYNFEQSEKKALCFGNKNPTGSRLTSLSWINETEESLLTCASDDGVIRIYHGLHTLQPAIQAPSLLTAFVAVPDLVPGTRGSGLVTNWQQGTGTLFTGGNSSTLRGWNMRHERCAISMPTQTDSCITTLTSDETTNSALIVAGFGDGSLRLFDARASRPEFTIKSVMKEHNSWIVQTHLYAGKHELVSGCVSGELKFWDLRYAKNSVRALEAHRSPMTALAVHDHAPIFASGSHNQFIKVFRNDGEQLALIRYHEGFLGERIGPVSCLAFHPHRLFLAAGATDSVIAIYAADK